MFRYKAIIEYEGSLFAGWQKQNSSPTIQSCLEDAIKKYCLYEVNIEGAGRTDSGESSFAGASGGSGGNPGPDAKSY